MTIYEARLVLELSGDYDELLLRKQYHIMTKKYHPDNCKLNGISLEIADRKIKEINAANALLSEHLKKNSYTSSNYYRTSSNVNYSSRSDYDRLQSVILNDLERKLKLNKESFVDFEILMNSFKAYSVIKKYEHFVEILKLRCSSFCCCCYDSYQELNEEYQKYISRYKRELTDMYNEFYDVYLRYYLVNDMKKSNLYNWLLENRNKNRDFLLVSELVSQIKDDLDKVQERIDEEFVESQLLRVRKIIDYYKSFAHYENIKEEISKLEKRTIGLIKLSVKGNGINLGIDYVKILDEKVIQLFYNYDEFLKGRQFRVDNIRQKLEKNNVVEENKDLLERLENEFDQERFERLENQLLSKVKELSIEALVRRYIPKNLKNKINNFDEYSFRDVIKERNNISYDENGFKKVLKKKEIEVSFFWGYLFFEFNGILLI